MYFKREAVGALRSVPKSVKPHIWGSCVLSLDTLLLRALASAGTLLYSGAMFRAAVKGAVGVSVFIAVPLLGAEMRFKTMKLPPNVDVHIEGSTARISGERIETVWNCLCAKDKGTCTIRNNTDSLDCYKGAADSCKTDCFLSIDLGGLLGSP